VPAVVVRLDPTTPLDGAHAAMPIADDSTFDRSTQPALEIGGVRAGMSVEALRRVLGPEAKSESQEAVKPTWQSAGYDTNAQLEFLIGFDTVLTYNQGAASTKLPFWSIFVRDGRIAVIKVTVYVPGTWPVEQAGFPPSCYLTRDPRGIEETFGRGHIVIEDATHEQTSYHYLERGITVLVKEGRISVMDIYEPLSGTRKDTIAQALGAGVGRRSSL
jgi:hypothetical protein